MDNTSTRAIIAGVGNPKLQQLLLGLQAAQLLLRLKCVPQSRGAGRQPGLLHVPRRQVLSQSRGGGGLQAAISSMQGLAAQAMVAKLFQENQVAMRVLPLIGHFSNDKDASVSGLLPCLRLCAVCEDGQGLGQVL